MIGLLAVLGAAILGFPAAGSALRPTVQISLTPNGPSPSVLNLTVGGVYLYWLNQDQVTHTLTFADGQCSFQVAPGERGSCSNYFSAPAGQYPYTVDGTFQGSVIVSLNPRTVTLTARRHTITQGGRLLLHGILDFPIDSPPIFESKMPVTLLARHDSHHPFKRVAVTAKWKKRQGQGSGGFPWKLSVHPKATTIYLAEATSAADYWEPATSRPFKVVVRRSRASR
ncbi:MAG: hypothetical protein ACXVRD_12045 [Gaiellaceae bacterium]